MVPAAVGRERRPPAVVHCESPQQEEAPWRRAEEGNVSDPLIF